MKLPEPDKIKPWCQARGIDLCILFGSQATGKARSNSDVDIALFSQTNFTLQKDLLRLYGELEDFFGYEVDLVIIERDTDPVLRLEIFRHGKPLYESQPGLFVEQRILAAKLYDDTEHLRRRRDRMLAQRILNLKYVDKTKYVACRQEE
jgi:predicted nucleotidyltransferase